MRSPSSLRDVSAITLTIVALLLLGSRVDAQARDAHPATSASPVSRTASRVAGAEGTTAMDSSARAADRKAQRKLDYVPAARFAEARRRTASAKSQGSPVHVAADQSTSYALVVRTDTSRVEQHARWDDVIVVQAGRGVVQFGERAEGRELLAAGEYRGGTLTKAYRLELGPGDVVRIPAGVPHAFWPVRSTDGASSAPFEYLIVKVRRGERTLTPP
jgi:mannose-6-phosphate isomerase-like protein (cupin superfamily)